MIKKDKNMNTINLSWKQILFICSVIILLPILINIFLFLPFPPTPNDLGNKDWLSFWGSFLGGCFGGITTLIAVYLTLKQNLQNHQQIIDEQNEPRTKIFRSLTSPALPNA